MWAGSLGLVVLSGTALSVTKLTGQTITPLLPCVTCELRASHVVTLGAETDEESPAERPHHVVRDGCGRYFVMAGFPVARILVYDSAGKLDSVWGRKGEGPGEYRRRLSQS